MKKKLRLKSLEVKSFITNTQAIDSATIKGGFVITGPGTGLGTRPNICTLQVNGCGGNPTTIVISVNVCPPDPTQEVGCNSYLQCTRDTLLIPAC